MSAAVPQSAEPQKASLSAAVQSPKANLPALLHRVFGHREFRAHQQPVCEAAAAGRDVLLVMPTGAGKSLCYQLPALARGGTALVISPLIALMDDQAGKLSALNLRVARIHSGLPREAARQACRDYLDGNLDFLFIAPERLRVPGFPEMLAKRKPALVAIDEAHCISQWGHDFRPDYRTLGQYLPSLRPSPIIALTATATPTVQKDILRALNLQDPAVFITGFRRTNLQIESSELSKPERTAFIAKLLSKPEARPAIVYASSRKSAEEIATALGKTLSAAVYHAGLDPGTRERVQTAFLSGRLEVVVATVAFGMGVDKADVRTVIHSALPGSVESYYQEIGRAGRDGLSSRAVLLHSFADRKTLDFLLERSYPPVSDLEKVAAVLRPEPQFSDELLAQLQMDRETLERCVEKLVGQGAATADFEGRIRGTSQNGNAENGWQRDYDAQVSNRRQQIDRMVAYAEGSGCRMNALVRHFGDQNDPGKPCGHCDGCSPQNSVSAPASQASRAERDDIQRLLRTLQAGPRSTGKLATEARLDADRKTLDRLLNGLAQAGLIHITTETFRGEEGRDISYRKVSLTPEGYEVDEAALDTVWLRGEADTSSKKKARSASAGGGRGASPPTEQPLTPEAERLLEQLREWRRQKAQERGAPAFTIFHDSVLRSLATQRAANLVQLSEIKGIGQEKLDRYGADLLALCRNEQLAEGSAPPIAAARPAVRKVERVLSPPTAPKSGPHAETMAATSTTPIRSTIYIPRKPVPTPPAAAAELSPAQQALDARLRNWRREQAAGSGLPSFFILSETALRKVVLTAPTTMQELGAVAELGTDKLARYGAAVVAICAEA